MIDWTGFAHTRENALYQRLLTYRNSHFFVSMMMSYRRRVGVWPTTIVIGSSVYVRRQRMGP